MHIPKCLLSSAPYGQGWSSVAPAVANIMRKTGSCHPGHCLVVCTWWRFRSFSSWLPQQAHQLPSLVHLPHSYCRRLLHVVPPHGISGTSLRYQHITMLRHCRRLYVGCRFPIAVTPTQGACIAVVLSIFVCQLCQASRIRSPCVSCSLNTDDRAPHRMPKGTKKKKGKQARKYPCTTRN